MEFDIVYYTKQFLWPNSNPKCLSCDLKCCYFSEFGYTALTWPYVFCNGWKGGSGEHQVLCASSGLKFLSQPFISGYWTIIREERKLWYIPLVLDKHFPCPVDPPSPNVCKIMGHLISPSTLLLPSSLLPSHSSCLCTIAKVCQAWEKAQSLGSNEVHGQWAPDLPCH